MIDAANPGPSGETPAPPVPRSPRWIADLRRFERPSAARATWQLANSLGPYLGLMAAMWVSLERGLPYWVTLALAVPAGGFMVRVFILFHDCVHGSFVGSARVRRALGRALGVLVFTPFGHWGHSHLGHHVTSGDLDRRGVGDVQMMTVEEYRAATPWQRFVYRVFRHPLGMLGLGPFAVFLVLQRIPPRRGSREARNSVHLTNLAIAGVVTAASLTIGLADYLRVQLPVLFFGGVGGIWLFFVQHQFPPSYWVRRGEWSAVDAALRGSSYFKLPRVLQWFSGNIGLHHVHHLRPRIPNYALQRCHDETPQLQGVEPLTFRNSLRALHLDLWDEAAGRFVTYAQALRGTLPASVEARGSSRELDRGAPWDGAQTP